jgi:hypothetical protein
MLYPSSGLQDINIGGPWNHRVSVRFQAQYSSPLAAIRFYEINKNLGYASGSGGKLRYDLCLDLAGLPAGSTLVQGVYLTDNNFTEWINAGGFPLIGFPFLPTLVKGTWYHFLLTNIDSDPVHNFVSADFLISKTGINPDPLSSVLYDSNRSNWTIYKELIASPFSIFYANGECQGNGGYQISPSGATQCGMNYGFGRLC